MQHPDRKLLILDFGSQYTQLIARRVRELGVYCEIFPYFASEERIQAFDPSGIILSGGPESVVQDNAPQVPSVVWSSGLPVLGICYGMQAMAQHFGGQVASAGHSEFGHTQVHLAEGESFMSGLQSGANPIDVWMSHGDQVTQCPSDFKIVASTDSCPIVAMANTSRHYYGVQFHPEVTHTEDGAMILKRFALDICQCETSWTPDNMIESSVQAVREQVGDEHVILGLSGGVDSSVAAALLHRAIGDQLTCVFVDNGLLRLGEAEQVMATFSAHLGVRVIHVDAKDRFLTALQGVEDPEAKRKVIGAEFINVFQEESEKIKDAKWLAQGTIYPDVIESALASSSDGTAHVIKSHHNVGGLPDHLHLQLVEPLRDLFKDEVRRLGVALGLPAEMVYRHPFPGPGLGVRILGEIKPEYVRILQEADAIFIEELRRHDWYGKTSQAFAVFLPVKSVGVVGDARCYDYVIALRSVNTIDFMTATWSQFPPEFLSLVSGRIMNEVSGVSRVVYDISSKPPSTIEWE